MGANTIAISHFIDFRMRINHSQRVGQYILKCKCTKKKGANATVCGKKLGVGLCLGYLLILQKFLY